MRIFQVTPAYPPSAHGGVSTHVDLISRGLDSRGHAVSIATTNRYDFRKVLNFSGLREVDGLKIYYAKAYWPSRYFFAPGLVKVMSKWISDADVVHVHDTRPFVGLAAYFAMKGRSIPYVLTCHGSLSPQIGAAFL